MIRASEARDEAIKNDTFEVKYRLDYELIQGCIEDAAEQGCYECSYFPRTAPESRIISYLQAHGYQVIAPEEDPQYIRPPLKIKWDML